MRERINRAAICSCSGNDGSYESSKKVHRASLDEAHEAFQAEHKSFIITVSDEPSPDTMVYLTIFCIKKKVRYEVVKKCQFKWSWA